MSKLQTRWVRVSISETAVPVDFLMLYFDADSVADAEATLQFMEKTRELEPDSAALVAAAILCALTVDHETAHQFIDFLDVAEDRLALEDRASCRALMRWTLRSSS